MILLCSNIKQQVSYTYVLYHMYSLYVDISIVHILCNSPLGPPLIPTDTYVCCIFHIRI